MTTPHTPSSGGAPGRLLMGYTACPVTYAKSVVVGGDSCTNGDYPELRKQRHSRKGGLRGRQAVTASEKTSPIRSSSGAEKHCTPKLTTTECGRGRTACESACVSADSVLGDARLKLDDCCCSDRYSNIMGLIWQKIGEARALRQHNFIKEARLKLHHARGLLKSISISGAGCCVVRQQRSLEDLRRKIDALADGLSSPRFRNSLRAEVSRLASRSPAHRGRCASESSTSTTTSNERVRGDGPREHTIKGLNCGCKMPTQPTRSSSPIEQRCSRRVQKFKKCAYEADHLKAHSNVNHFNGSVNLESYHNEIFREWDLTTGVTQRAMSDLYETGPKSSRRHLKVDDGSSGRHNVCCACLHPASAADGSLSRSSKCFAPPCCTPMATGRKNVREAAEGGEYSCKNNGDDSLLAARCHTQVYTPTPSAPITASSPQLLSSRDSLPEHSVRAASHLFHSKAPGAAGGDPCFKQNALLRTFRIPARNSLGRKGMEKAIQPTALPHTPPARSRLNGYTYSSNLQTPFPPAMGNERQEPCRSTGDSAMCLASAHGKYVIPHQPSTSSTSCSLKRCYVPSLFQEVPSHIHGNAVKSTNDERRDTDGEGGGDATQHVEETQSPIPRNTMETQSVVQPRYLAMWQGVFDVMLAASTDNCSPPPATMGWKCASVSVGTAAKPLIHGGIHNWRSLLRGTSFGCEEVNSISSKTCHSFQLDSRAPDYDYSTHSDAYCGVASRKFNNVYVSDWALPLKCTQMRAAANPAACQHKTNDATHTTNTYNAIVVESLGEKDNVKQTTISQHLKGKKTFKSAQEFYNGIINYVNENSEQYVGGVASVMERPRFTKLEKEKVVRKLDEAYNNWLLHYLGISQRMAEESQNRKSSSSLSEDSPVSKINLSKESLKSIEDGKLVDTMLNETFQEIKDEAKKTETLLHYINKQPTTPADGVSSVASVSAAEQAATPADGVSSVASVSAAEQAATPADGVSSVASVSAAEQAATPADGVSSVASVSAAEQAATPADGVSSVASVSAAEQAATPADGVSSVASVSAAEQAATPADGVSSVASVSAAEQAATPADGVSSVASVSAAEQAATPADGVSSVASVSAAEQAATPADGVSSVASVSAAEQAATPADGVSSVASVSAAEQAATPADGVSSVASVSAAEQAATPADGVSSVASVSAAEQAATPADGVSSVTSVSAAEQAATPADGVSSVASVSAAEQAATPADGVSSVASVSAAEQAATPADGVSSVASVSAAEQAATPADGVSSVASVSAAEQAATPADGVSSVASVSAAEQAATPADGVSSVASVSAAEQAATPADGVSSVTSVSAAEQAATPADGVSSVASVSAAEQAATPADGVSSVASVSAAEQAATPADGVSSVASVSAAEQAATPADGVSSVASVSAAEQAATPADGVSSVASVSAAEQAATPADGVSSVASVSAAEQAATPADGVSSVASVSAAEQAATPADGVSSVASVSAAEQAATPADGVSSVASVSAAEQAATPADGVSSVASVSAAEQAATPADGVSSVTSVSAAEQAATPADGVSSVASVSAAEQAATPADGVSSVASVSAAEQAATPADGVSSVASVSAAEQAATPADGVSSVASVSALSSISTDSL